MKTIVQSIIFIKAGNLISKVSGKRNYAIRINNRYKTAYAGTFGSLKRHRKLTELFSVISRDGINWGFYTYKTDFNKVIEALKEMNYEVINLS